MHKQFMRIFFFMVFIFGVGDAICQPTWTIDPFGKEKKPEVYEEKMLGSEKTATKKFTPFRRFVQNNVTHYNFYYNANAKLNAVMERAKLAQVDDFSRLLSFYPYSFENTSSQKVELDSVILKSTGGILLHDLRSDWVDDLYLLIGKAYFLRNELDSAALTFQFINYNLFPRKKKDDDENKVIGGNSQAAQGTLSIADKEKRNIVQKTFTKAPSRNESLLWLTRTLTEKKQFGDAAGMLNILHNDPNLPKRLVNDLNEVTAFWFYAQDTYDSSAVYLEKALSAAENKQDLARWEYLLAQMLEMSGKYDLASEYYMKAAKHTVNPLLDIHAHLNEAKMARQSGNTKELENNISRLQKMAKKDKYESYRDIIFYSIAQLNLQMPDTATGISYYKKSIATPATSTTYKEKSFLQLANLSYEQKKYPDAFAWYDSLMPSAYKVKVDYNLKERRDALANVVEKIRVIELEDSLQKIAAMPAAERDAFLKKLSKALRKASGSKEEDFTSSTNTGFSNSKNEPTDLFAPAKGEWYFYNSGLKSKGFSEFKSRWGKRENVDNWRRASATAANAKGPAFGDPLDAGQALGKDSATSGLVENSYDALLQNVPLTPEAIDSSNKRIAENMLALARIFQFEIQDYDEAIRVYDEYLVRFPNRLMEGEVYLNLYYCWNKKGDQAKADYYKNLVVTKFNGKPSGIKISHPEYLRPDLKNPEVTARYQTIYDLFIEGRFDSAFAIKKEQDSIYGDSYWSPQLLYIEAIYHIRQKNDSLAIERLTYAEASSTDEKFKQKMNTMIEVLGRRKEIENYLSTLQVTRVEENKILIPVEVKPETKILTPSSNNPAQVKTIKPINRTVSSDSTIRSIPSLNKAGFRLQPDKPHLVLMVLDKVDQVYVNEAKNAFLRYNRNNFASTPFTINKDVLTTDKQLLLIAPFNDADDALAYYEKIKKAAPTEVSWLPKNKYSFLIINADNLQILKENKDLGSYIQLLNNNYGNKF